MSSDRRRLNELAARVRDSVSRLYAWYVPPFKVELYELEEGELFNLATELYKLGGLRRWLRLDRHYYATDPESFVRIVEWDWTDTRSYTIDRFDCDKFALYFKARLALDFGVNAVGVVLDYSSAHAYNLVILKSNGKTGWLLFEPQNDMMFKYEERDQKLYAMKDYYLIL